MNSHMILVINCGSSSIKFAVINPHTQACPIQGLAERLSTDQSQLSYETSGDEQKQTLLLQGGDHGAALKSITEILSEMGLLAKLNAIGHRVVHGGETFSESMLIDNESIETLKQLNHLAPLHNPVNVLGIETLQQLLPELPQIAVFDTAFHQSLPEAAYLYAVPYELYENDGVRRYGFHGTSYRYVSQAASERLNKPADDSHFLIAHLGNGCSACAVSNGKSVDTSMGLTPLEGLAMGTRCGDVDPGLIPFLAQRKNLSLDQVMDMLNKESGLLGISGSSNDMRSIQQSASEGDKRATLAIEVFAFRVARYLGALAVSLPRIDALVFTGGIGENDRLSRSLILEHLAILGFELDGNLNKKNGNDVGIITTPSSTTAMVIQTNEELMIAIDSSKLVN